MLKRDFRLFLRGLLPAMVLTALFALICTGACLAAGKGAEDLYSPVHVAVVDQENSLASRLLVSAVGDMDYIAPLMELERMDLETAEEALREGQLAAVIILPEHFVDDITQGRQGGGQILLSAAAASYAQVVEGAARCGQLLLAAGQYGVFSGEELLREAGIGGEAYDAFLTHANLALLEEGMGAWDRYFHVTVTDYDGTWLSPAAWYGVGWLTLLLFLCSMFFTELYRRDLNRPMLCRLKAVGVSDGAFLTGKLVFPLLLRWLFLVPVLLLIPVFFEVSPHAGAVISALAAAAAAGIMGCALILCLPSGHTVAAALSIAGLFLCGGIIPRQMLPDVLLTVGDLTPFGAVHSLLRPAFGGKASLLGWLLAAVYTAGALMWMGHRLNRLRGGGDRS